MAVTDLYVNSILDFTSKLAKKSIVNINGEEKELPIYQTVRNEGTIRHYVYLTNEIGTITNARLVDSQGRELQTKNFEVTKKDDGLVIVFAISIELKGE